MKKYLLKISIAMFFAVSCIVPVQAFDKNLSDSIDKHIDECMAKQNYSPIIMHECVYEGEKMWLKEINRLEGEISKNLSPEALKIFNKSKEHWLEYYKFEEELMHKTLYSKDGLINVQFARGFMFDLVKNRAQILDGFYHDLTEEY